MRNTKKKHFCKGKPILRLEAHLQRSIQLRTLTTLMISISLSPSRLKNWRSKHGFWTLVRPCSTKMTHLSFSSRRWRLAEAQVLQISRIKSNLLVVDHLIAFYLIHNSFSNIICRNRLLKQEETRSWAQRRPKKRSILILKSKRNRKLLHLKL